MKQPALVIIKPDGIKKGLVGTILDYFEQAGLKIIAIKMTTATKAQVEEHYKHIKGKPFFKQVVDYLVGKLHGEKRIIIVVYYGDDAIRKCRKIAGATNPEEASPKSIRGAYGRVTTKGVYENIVHVSSDKAEAKREIMLWFEPEELMVNLYPKKVGILKDVTKKVWA